MLYPDLDEPCESDQECITENSRCGEVCRCKVNYIQSRQKDKCLKGNKNHELWICIYQPFPTSEMAQWLRVIVLESLLINVRQIP
jgi:hypothetical protein